MGIDYPPDIYVCSIATSPYPCVSTLINLVEYLKIGMASLLDTFFLRTSVHSIRKEKEIYRRWFTYSIKKENSPLLPVSWSLLLSFYQVLSYVLIKTVGNTLWAVKQTEALQERTAAVPGASCSIPERLALCQILAAASHNLSIALLHHCKKSAPMQDTTSKPMVFLESIYTHLCPGA